MPKSTTSNRRRRSKQGAFFSQKSIYASWKQLGGSKMTSHPKRRRPVSTKHELHLVMKSDLAKGDMSMRSARNLKKVNLLVHSIAKRMGVRVSRYENVGNHLHLLIRVPSHHAYVMFVRGISSAIARAVTGATKTRAKGIRFWLARPFTRIVTWGRDRLGLLRYLGRNRIQAVGFSVFMREEELGYRLTG